MALFTASLNSGSNGNCYYVGDSTHAVLIDVGISCREVEKRLKKLSLSIDKIKAIFISHEHGDHIKGVTTLANKYNIPVYITPLTAKYGPRLIGHLTKPFEHEKNIAIGDLTITPFSKQHDAVDPYSFVISCNELAVGVFTDIGTCCNNVVKHFKQCNAIFLESNYDEEMLENGKYPIHLKNRIRGDKGHLSNDQALQLVEKHKSDKLSHIFLSHLSKENNSEALVKSLFEKQFTHLKIEIAYRHTHTSLFYIGDNATEKIAKSKQLQIFNF